MKVLHLPSAVGGNSWGLSRAERRLGLDSKVLVAYHDWIAHDADIKMNLTTGSWSGKAKSLVKLVKKFLEVRSAYDIYHFNFGTSLLDFPEHGLLLLDVPFYHSKSKIFVTYNGCDARQKYPTIERAKIAPCYDDECYNGMCNSGKFDDIRRRRIEKFSKHAVHMFALNPDLMWFLPPGMSSFLPYTVASWFEIENCSPSFDNKKLTIVHAPTQRAAKGTGTIVGVLEKLGEKHGDSIEIKLVERMPHKEALEIYKGADLIIDQILAGWYGGFAVETMKMGKPVLAYIREEDLIFIPEQMKDDLKGSVINAHPDNLAEVLERCIADRAFLKEHAQNGYDYVNTWHDPIRIAKTVKEYYES